MTEGLTQIATIVLAQRDKYALETALGIYPQTSTLKILSPGKAFEVELGIHVTGKDIERALSTDNIRADICLQPPGNRKKNLLICDMDSTLIGQECIDELADFAGVKDRVSAITERAMRGEIDFEGALTERVALLKGLSEDVLQTCFDERISINPGAKTLCETMKLHGAKTVIVSGGFTFFTSRIREAGGFHHDQANELLIEDGILTGRVAMPILGREAKLEALKSFSAELGGSENAVAIGDGANDLAMVTASGLGIAYYAKPAVAEAAHCAINQTDLRTALYYQGYSDDEIVEAG